ncbi:hypothetical protein GLX27_001217 [Malassezia furfur]|uniref:HTH La-type RNA-binding domain-containing protein n=1 Tax=Malassezia furfur TaxID=55194 RepID=A0ABY8EQ64_MALFU|nr:hypothetical protein GLX27_001217 [Malassezia furfur]
MSRCAWTTTQTSKSAPNVSYAERLRKAASQKTQAQDKESSPKQSDALITAALTPAPKEDEPPMQAIVNDTTQPERSVRRSTTPSRSPSNVWTERMRERMTQVQKKDTTTSAQDTTVSSTSGSIPTPVLSPPSLSSTAGSPRELRQLEQHSTAPTTSGSSSGSANATPPTANVPSDNDIWLARIHLLNGGPPTPRFVRRAQESPNNAHGDSTQSAEPVHLPPFAPTVLPANYAMPMGPPIPTSDGSFAPVRSSDQHNSTMQAYAQAARSMPMGYFTMMPMPLGFDYPVDGRDWARQGRDGRPRGRGTGRVRTNAITTTPQLPLPPKVAPHVMVPGAPMHVAPSMSYSGSSEADGTAVASPAASRAETQSNVSSSDADESRSDAGEVQSSSLDSMQGTGWPPHAVPALYPRGPPMAPMQVPMMPYAYFVPAPTMPAPYDPRFGPMMPAMAMFPPSASPAPMTSNSPILVQQLLYQVEFYFSDNNLELDFFLRQQMDAHGFVPLDTVLNFRRVQDIFQSVVPPGPGQPPLDRDRRLSLLRDAVMSSQVLELSQDRMRLRRKHNWERYVLPAQTER